MMLNVFLDAGQRAARVCEQRFPEVQCYVFGSCARREADPEDLDVLLVYPDSIDSRAVRRLFSDAAGSVPLDLCLVSQAEEARHALVRLQGAIPL